MKSSIHDGLQFTAANLDADWFVFMRFQKNGDSRDRDVIRRVALPPLQYPPSRLAPGLNLRLIENLEQYRDAWQSIADVSSDRQLRARAWRRHLLRRDISRSDGATNGIGPAVEDGPSIGVVCGYTSGLCSVLREAASWNGHRARRSLRRLRSSRDGAEG